MADNFKWLTINKKQASLRANSDLTNSCLQSLGPKWRTANKKQAWQAFLRANPDLADNCLQSFNWGLSHEQSGGKTFWRILYDRRKPVAGYMALLEVGRRQRFLTLAGGPLLDWSQPELLASFKADITAIASRERCVYVRIRPQTPDSDVMRKYLRQAGFRRAPSGLAVELAGILDLEQPEEIIRKGFNKSLRHKVRDAERDEAIKVRVSRDVKDVVLFSELHQEHAQRRRYSPFTKTKLVKQFETFLEDDEVLLYFARREGEVLAAHMIFFFGREASHLYGISTTLGQKYSSAPILHLSAMAEARRRGLKTYNFWGIVGTDQVKHRYYGLSQFKRGFGVKPYQYVPAHDLIIRRWPYMAIWVYLTILRKWRRL
ncbi:peptidoglycan bridge formation glycyltransferase FemA/FemB family protein [Candidatus Saccharibacteria bacterium]|nr:peptidoglycan bridge formation glycyltransferase FemA/FemB family protein [Candidatus Saccharibacteria bacterium]